MQVSNYMPICLMSKVAEIVKKELKIRIVSFVNKNEMISRSIYGFKTGKFTEDAISKLMKRMKGIYSLLDR